MEHAERLSAFENCTVSTVVRFHDPSQLLMLDRALFSLALQSYADVQVIVVIQNGYPRLIQEVADLLTKQPFGNPSNEGISQIHCGDVGGRSDHGTVSIPVSNHRIVAVGLPPGIDGRSVLLNEGIKAAQGRFLAFLDYDDILYQYAYERLVDRLHASGAAVAVGGCMVAQHRVLSGGASYYVEQKAPLVKSRKVKADLFSENFIPIHTYVIDRAAVDPSYMLFDTHLSANEDYLFLLRLASEYEFDFGLQGTAVGEYCQRSDGSNTIQVGCYRPEKEVNLIYSREYVEKIKRTLQVKITAWEIATIVRERDALRLLPQVPAVRSVLLIDEYLQRRPTVKRVARKMARFVWRVSKDWLKIGPSN